MTDQGQQGSQKEQQKKSSRYQEPCQGKKGGVEGIPVHPTGEKIQGKVSTLFEEKACGLTGEPKKRYSNKRQQEMTDEGTEKEEKDETCARKGGKNFTLRLWD